MSNKIPNLHLLPEPSPFQDRETYLQKNHNWYEIDRKLKDLDKWQEDYTDRIENLITDVSSPDEIKDAHQSKENGHFNTLNDRLEYIEDTGATKKELQNATTWANLHRLGMKYHTQGSTGSNAQGFASLGNQIVVQYYQNWAPLDSQYGTLTKFDVTDGNEIMSNEIKGFHGNSMTYNQDDGMLYLCPAEDSSGKKEQAQKTTILQISPETLTIKNTIDLTGITGLPTLHAIGYDSKDKIYIVSNQKTLEFYSDAWKFLYTIELSDVIGFTPDYMQGIQTYKDNLYYIGGRRSQIWKFRIDHKNKKITFSSIYSFDDFQENLYPIGEIEGLGFDSTNNKIYLSSHISVGNFGGLAEYFVTNPDFKVVAQGGRTASIQNTNAKAINFYVGKTNNYNPDGTKNNPFGSLLEASVCMRTPYTPFNTLELKDDFPDETMILINVNGAMINTGKHKVKGTVIINSYNLYFTNLQTTKFSRWNYNALYIYNSKVRINYFSAKGISKEDKVEYEIFIERSDVFLNNNSHSSIFLKNSNLTSSGSIFGVTKDNGMSRVFGLNNIGAISNTNSISKLKTIDFNYYRNIEVDITTKIRGSNLVFNLSSPVRGIMHLTGMAELRGILYICSFHFVQNNPTDTTLTIFKAKDMSQVKPSNYNIKAYLTDL